jgi:cell division protein FtsB
VSIEADREAVLLARIERLSNDVAAQRRALERVTDERNRLHHKVELLAAVKASVAEVTNG